MDVPELDQEFFCIANTDTHILAAIVSSYIYKLGKYTSLYEFPSASTSEDGIDSDIIDEHQISRSRSREYSIKVHNVIRRTRGCKYLILVGLSDNQKSYLSFLNEYNVIEIQEEHEIDNLLSPLLPKKEFLLVNKKDVLKSLFVACQNNQFLKIDDNQPTIDFNDVKTKGIVIVEDNLDTSTIIAVNYALSINANLEVVQKPKIDIRKVENFIEMWQEGDMNAYNDLSATVYPAIEHINFGEYDYATFFTNGIPYSLILGNILPITHVNLNLYPDFFIFNNIYFEKYEQLSSALVFSPLEFSDEETDFTIAKLEERNFFLKTLLGPDATANNLDFHVKEYPFDLLHICSHGGEISGYAITENFTDSHGNSHTIEYDEVVSFSPQPGQELIKVTTKMLWRKFDGFEWRSPELKAQNFPHYVFSDMLNYIHGKKEKNRIKKDIIFGSCTIKCFDFNYQAMFNILAASQSPVIFNNTCWSWSRISDSFLAVGARTYIGTLWAIDNTVAKLVAENFYDTLKENSISDILYKSLRPTLGTKNENIYMIWGLHFSTLKQGKTIAESKIQVARKMLQSLSIWKEKLKNTKQESIKKNVEEIIDWNATQITRYFKGEVFNLIKESRKQ